MSYPTRMLCATSLLSDLVVRGGSVFQLASGVRQACSRARINEDWSNDNWLTHLYHTKQLDKIMVISQCRYIKASPFKIVSSLNDNDP